jgi:NAD(P)-dependent dehydrogenase (short-subunit alcohol dehydrogenase family)
MTKFTPEEVRGLIQMLETIVEDRMVLSDIDEETRIALLKVTGRISRPTRDENRKTAKAFRFRDRQRAQEHDRTVRAATEIRAARRAEVYAAPARLVSMPVAPGGETQETNGASHIPEKSGATATPPDELHKARQCYVCKCEFRKVHFFYDAMCGACAELNYAKRFQTASLAGRIALITGARIKIGYQAALMMLRAGARVIVTTRFPRDAASRYAREADFSTWRDRLEIHGLDLRHTPSVEVFARYLTQTKPHLDILINNAAQTVRRPPAFYSHMLDLERSPLAELPEPVQALLASHEDCKRAIAFEPTPQLGGDDALPSGAELSGGFVAWRGDGPATGIRSSAELAQIPCAFDDVAADRALFPAGRTDADLQQIDLRAMNSWRMTLSDVPSAEMLEVQLVNAVAPFILCAKLKELMLRRPTNDRHIVNVSAMEGQFARHTKTDKHPHTNMAKAALNMLTLTSAPDYAAQGIFMNAVDTGWVTDEDPALLAKRKQELHDFQPPLDIVDGAARICDPFFSGLLTGQHVWGKFLKDYAEVDW